jgi:deazaflavin-dependent oxidoreductase (nitroreductase family)
MALDPDGRVGRVIQAVAGHPRFARVAPKVVPPLDRVVSRLTGGRIVPSAGLVPMVVLVSTGARSGLERETPLATVPDGDAFYLVGSNFGREAHPAWTHNLLAHPAATVVHRGRRIPVTARLLDAEEKAAAWPKLTAVWATYDRYEDRVERDLRVFRLEPRTGQPG